MSTAWVGKLAHARVSVCLPVRREITVLIRRERTGKTGGRAVHNKRRADRPFVHQLCGDRRHIAGKVNSLVMRGAFTAQLARKKESWNRQGGPCFRRGRRTGRAAPGKLCGCCRARFERVGAPRPLKLDIRLITRPTSI